MGLDKTLTTNSRWKVENKIIWPAFQKICRPNTDLREQRVTEKIKNKNNPFKRIWSLVLYTWVYINFTFKKTISHAPSFRHIFSRLTRTNLQSKNVKKKKKRNKRFQLFAITVTSPTPMHREYICVFGSLYYCCRPEGIPKKYIRRSDISNRIIV